MSKKPLYNQNTKVLTLLEVYILTCVKIYLIAGLPAPSNRKHIEWVRKCSQQQKTYRMGQKWMCSDWHNEEDKDNQDNNKTKLHDFKAK